MAQYGERSLPSSEGGPGVNLTPGSTQLWNGTSDGVYGPTEESISSGDGGVSGTPRER